MESHKQIEDRAAAYLAQRDSGEWTVADKAQLDRWLKESIAHRVAYLRLESAWYEASRLKALSAGIPTGTIPRPGEWRQSPFFDRDSRSRESIKVSTSSHAADHQSTSTPQSEERYRIDTGPEQGPLSVPRESTHTSRIVRVRVFAVAATVLLAIGTGIYWFAPDLRAGDRYSTPIGKIASVPLADGSRITLNTASQVRVELTPQERHIRLDGGEAFFEVAHDVNRPFVVQVGRKRVIAVGTKFSVRLNGSDIRVVVTEGKVRVETESAVPRHLQVRVASTEQRNLGEVFLTPGNIASVGDEGVVVENRSLAQAQADLSWRQGYLTFQNTSLADAVAEFNRYNAHKIKIDNPQVAAIRISGTFRASNSEAFVRVLGDGFAIHARNADDQITLTQ